jgi:microcystin-dependent protein
MSLLSVPLKVILPWHADLQNETPPLEYAICDGRTLNSSQQDINPGGSYTTPDLRHMFLVGADLTKAAGTAAAGVNTGNINAAAGAPGPKGTGGENQHTTVQNEMPPHAHTPLNGGDFTTLDSPGGPGGYNFTVGGGSESRRSTTSTAGGGAPHENRPRYYGIVYIMKVKI